MPMPGASAMEQRIQEMEKRFQEQESSKKSLESQLSDLGSQLREEHEKVIMQNLPGLTHTGNVKQNVAPLSGADSTQMQPW